MTQFEKEKKHLDEIKSQLKSNRGYYLKKLDELDHDKSIDPDLE